MGISNIYLSFCSFSHSGVCFDGLKLSTNDVIVSQKRSNGDRKQHFSCMTIILLALFAQRKVFGLRNNQNSLMETTCLIFIDDLNKGPSKVSLTGFITNIG